MSGKAGQPKISNTLLARPKDSYWDCQFTQYSMLLGVRDAYDISILMLRVKPWGLPVLECQAYQSKLDGLILGIYCTMDQTG